MKKFKRHIQAALLFFLTIIFINCGLFFLARWNNQPTDIFLNIAVSIIITWIIFLIAYYVWAIGFYNINLGWTDEDWLAKSGQKAEVAADAKINVSTATSTDESTKEPDGNPNNDQSLGLPTGTVRATIALSLLIAGLSMAIASFSFKNNYPLNALFIDHFEFFKTGFLMMIAFYFGAKSLDILRNTNNAAVATNDENTKTKTKTAAEDQTNPNSNPM